MRRVGISVVIAWFFSIPTLSAQVIECPGTLPSVGLEKEKVMPAAERMLQRFMAAFSLYGLKVNAIDEATIVGRYKDHPEQLLTKLTYLSLQCHIWLLQTPDKNKQAMRDLTRKVFFDYVLRAPDPASTDLTPYINDAATRAKEGPRDTTVDLAIAGVEAEFSKLPWHEWRKKWYPNEGDQRPEATGRSAVIAASPCYENEGWAMLRSFQELWPKIYFELHVPLDNDSPFYSIVAGRGLTTKTANDLLKMIQDMGLPKDSYVFDGSGDANQKNEKAEKTKVVCDHGPIPE